MAYNDLAENYKLFPHIKKAVDRCKTTSFALVLFSKNFSNGSSYFTNLSIYRQLDGKQLYSSECCIYYVDLADYDLPKEYMDEFTKSCPQTDMAKALNGILSSVSPFIDLTSK